MTHALPPAHMIRTTKALRALVDELADAPLLAVDTESNSLYAYRSRVCLVQLSTREKDYIVDPLAIDDMQPLGDLFYNPSIEKIFHAAEYDLICLRRDFGFEIVNLFDTMYAARVVGIKSIGLASMLNQYFGVRVDKSHQLDDWGKRPLPDESLKYAQMDTHFLPDLRDQLHSQLKADGRLEEAAEVFQDVTRISAREREFDPDGFWKIGRPAALTRRQMAMLRELYTLRDELARSEDQPEFKVFNNDAMIELARQNPRSYTDLFNISNLPPRVVRMYGDRLLDALERGAKSRLPSPPVEDRPDPELAERYVALHTWRKERAQQRGVDSNIIVSKETLWQLARELPSDMKGLVHIEGLGDWRRNMYGQELLEVIAGLRQNGSHRTE